MQNQTLSIFTAAEELFIALHPAYMLSENTHTYPTLKFCSHKHTPIPLRERLLISVLIQKLLLTKEERSKLC